MKNILVGNAKNRKPENRYKRNRVKDHKEYIKQPIITKNCSNTDCTNTFEDTPNGKQKFCSPKCFRKVNGRISKNPRTKKNENVQVNSNI